MQHFDSTLKITPTPTLLDASVEYDVESIDSTKDYDNLCCCIRQNAIKPGFRPMIDKSFKRKIQAKVNKQKEAIPYWHQN